MCVSLAEDATVMRRSCSVLATGSDVTTKSCVEGQCFLWSGCCTVDCAEQHLDDQNGVVLHLFDAYCSCFGPEKVSFDSTALCKEVLGTSPSASRAETIKSPAVGVQVLRIAMEGTFV